jgi:integrase
MFSTLQPFAIKNTSETMPFSEYQTFLEEYSSKSAYDDLVWYIDKRYHDRNFPKGILTFHFSKLSAQHQHILKQYVLKRLLHRMSAKTLSTHCSALKEFFVFINIEMPSTELEQIPQTVVVKFWDAIQAQHIKPNTKATKISTIRNFLEVMEYNTILQYFHQFDIVFNKNKRHPEKLISKEILKQLDTLYYDNLVVPLEHRTAYWLLRLLPNRVEEVLSMRIECLKKISDSEYLLVIPTFKQSGQYVQPDQKGIIIRNENVGTHLISFIKEQQIVAQNLQDQITSQSERGFLFTHVKRGEMSMKKPFQEWQSNSAYLMKSPAVNKILRRACEHIEAKTATGKPFYATSHSFRHNAITDRLSTGTFRPIDIMWLTKHKNIRMITDAYYHPSHEHIKIAEEQVNAQITQQDINECKARIIQSKYEKKYQQLLDNPFAYQVPGGICSDNSNCKSYMWECLQCPSFVPDANKLSYFQEQVTFWANKLTLADLNSNSLLKENASYNLSLNVRIVEAIHQLNMNGENHAKKGAQ